MINKHARTLSITLKVYRYIFREMYVGIVLSWTVTLISLTLRAGAISILIQTAAHMQSSKEEYLLFDILVLSLGNLVLLTTIALTLSSLVTYFEYKLTLHQASKISLRIFREVVFMKVSCFPWGPVHAPAIGIIRSGAVGFIKPIQSYILAVPYLVILFSCLLMIFQINLIVGAIVVFFLTITLLPQALLQNMVRLIHFDWRTTAGNFAKSSAKIFGVSHAGANSSAELRNREWINFFNLKTTQKFYESQLLFRTATIKSQFISRTMNYAVISFVLVIFYFDLMSSKSLSGFSISFLVISLVGLAVSASTLSSLLTTALRFESDFISFLRIQGKIGLDTLRYPELTSAELELENQNFLQYAFSEKDRVIHLFQPCNFLEIEKIMKDIGVDSFTVTLDNDQFTGFIQNYSNLEEHALVLDLSMKGKFSETLSDRRYTNVKVYFLNLKSASKSSFREIEIEGLD